MKKSKKKIVKAWGVRPKGYKKLDSVFLSELLANEEVFSYHRVGALQRETIPVEIHFPSDA